jgi:hypothetical protein
MIRTSMRTLAVALVMALLAVGCSSTDPVTDFGFDDGPEGWVAGFADYPADGDPALYQLVADWRALPSNLDGSALYSSGRNASDDLWMYWKRSIEGLEPDTEYSVEMSIQLASNVPEGLVGIGGSPGESVFIKAGASTDEPDAEPDAQGWLRLTVDKGNQAEGGAEAVVVGTIANPNLDPATADGTVFALMTLDSAGLGLTATTDGSGALWVFVGTDSGFEGPTEVYYDRIEVTLEPVG